MISALVHHETFGPALTRFAVVVAHLAQVLGAALLAGNRSSIASRKARLTYGTNACELFDQYNAAHKQSNVRPKFFGNKLYLEVFQCYVERGDDLPVGTVHKHNFSPLTENQQDVEFDVVVSKKAAKNIKFVQDPAFKHVVSTLTTVKIPVDMTVGFESRGVCLSLTFGGTELGVRCTRLSDGHEVQVETVYVEEIGTSSYGQAD